MASRTEDNTHEINASRGLGGEEFADFQAECNGPELQSSILFYSVFRFSGVPFFSCIECFGSNSLATAKFGGFQTDRIGFGSSI